MICEKRGMIYESEQLSEKTGNVGTHVTQQSYYSERTSHIKD